MIAALFVLSDGPYASLPDVDLWDKTRDARRYGGPFKVIAPPPCARWGRYWFGGPSARVRRVKGDDGGCFAAALAAVRRWGGVLEHPAASAAWSAFGLLEPPRAGGWVVADWLGGWTCCVDQGHYGHRATEGHLAVRRQRAVADPDVGKELAPSPAGRRLSLARGTTAEDSHGCVSTAVQAPARRDTDPIS